MSFEIINDFSGEPEIAIRPQVYMQFGMSQILSGINCSEVFGRLVASLLRPFSLQRKNVG